MKENIALKHFGHANQMYLQAQQRYEDLVNYHIEYQQNLNNKGRESITVSILHNQANFIEQLEHLMREQKKICNKKLADMKQSKERWLVVHAEHEAMKKLYQSKKQKHALLMDKKEQEFIEDLLNSRREYK